MRARSVKTDSRNRPDAKRAHRSDGFTYLGLLVTIAVMGVMLAGTGTVWQLEERREKERELLFVGNQFRQALDGYYQNTPPRERRYPSSLEELLKDPRRPSTERYLRKVYRDPFTGNTDWGVIKGPGGEIYGIHSLSEEEPLKKGGFALADKSFEGKSKYADWVFMHVPGGISKPFPALVGNH